MPLGLSNAPGTFQRMMDVMLAGLKWSLVYLDDIVVFAPTFDENLVRLETVLRRIREAGLKLKLAKCRFLARQLPILGYVVSGAGIQPDTSKIVAVQEFPTPTCVKEVQSFVGLCSYYRKYIRNFAILVCPLTELTRKDREFKWTGEQVEVSTT